MLARALQQFEAGFPFVLFRKPDAAELTGFFQKDATIYLAESFEENGYVFAPFYEGQRLLIPIEKAEMLSIKWQKGEKHNNTVPIAISEKEHDQHVALVQKGIDAIKKQQFSKVVLSRRQEASNGNSAFTAVFENMLNTYTEANVYCFFHPVTGLWMGAFAERLLRLDGNRISTMALAGTRSKGNEGAWGTKEKQEQQFVTDAIVEALQVSGTDIEISEPKTIQAGKLEHIQSLITARLLPGATPKALIEALHPTPAVCGLPKEAARHFIIKEEGYDREYYAGFHGLLNVQGETDLFVNLRCMKWGEGSASLYVGGGITEGSDPESEWLETVKKAGTMNSIII